MVLQACGAQEDFGYIKKEKHTVIGKQNLCMCVCVTEREREERERERKRNELSFRNFGRGCNRFPHYFLNDIF